MGFKAVSLPDAQEGAAGVIDSVPVYNYKNALLGQAARVTAGAGVSIASTPAGTRFRARVQPNNIVGPVQFGSAYSVQGWYNGLIILGSATTVANGTIPAGALPTSPPSGGGFYTGGACLIINQPDRFLTAGQYPIPANQICWVAIKVGTTGPSDSPANTPIYACSVDADQFCSTP